MLTVDFDRLDLQPGHLVLDMGAGAGRHSFECLRRGARVVALDYDLDELVGVRTMFWAMQEEGDVPADSMAVSLRGDALRLPFPDNTFDRIICSEVLEHIPDDRGAIAELVRVLKPGGVIATTVPAWLPERICWTLSAEYHAPLARGGHVRIYTEGQLKHQLAQAGLDVQGSHRAHALHAPYWWLKCLVGTGNDTHPAVQAYHRILLWDISKATPFTRIPDRVLNPVIGKSVVIYSRRPLEGGDAATAPIADGAGRQEERVGV